MQKPCPLELPDESSSFVFALVSSCKALAPSRVLCTFVPMFIPGTHSTYPKGGVSCFADTFAFASTHKANPTAKAKEPFLANATDNNNHSSKNINSVSNKRKIIIVGDGFEKIQLVRKLDEKQLDVLLIDKINYHQF